MVSAKKFKQFLNQYKKPPSFKKKIFEIREGRGKMHFSRKICFGSTNMVSAKYYIGIIIYR